MAQLRDTVRDERLPALTWAPLVLTEERIFELWDKFIEFPQVFDDFSKDNFSDFVARLMEPKNIFIDIGPGLGVAAGFAVKPKLDMIIHLVMFDRRLRGREPLFKEIINFFFSRLQLHRMTAIIPVDCRTAIKLAERLGFKKEGIQRGSLLRNGQFVDVHLYGMLKEEVS